MYRKLIYLISFIFVLALAGHVFAQDAEIPPAATPLPVIDGIREDVWSASEEHGILELDADNWPDSDTDCSGSWWALWDSDYLYVFVDVNDEDLQNDSGESWQDDSIEIYFDADNDKPTSYASAGDEYQYRAAWNTEVPEFQEYHHGTRSMPGVEFIVTETDDGYTLEIKFPWEALYIEGKPTLGDLMGFEVMINDDDGGANRDTQLSWHSTGNAAWNNPSVFGTVVLAAGLKASNPTPRHGAKGVLAGLMQWIAGKNAETHNVYFGTNPTPGNDEFIQNQAESEYLHQAGLEPETTYYWRIDVVEADQTRTGDIWYFTSAPLTAHSPDPADDARWIELDADLSWQPGMYAQTHDVYFGTDETAVANADTSSDEFKGNQPLTTYEPGPLQENTTYYWRIDELNDQRPDDSPWIGDLWSFTALGAGAGIKAEYYDNTNLSGQPTLTRTDETIDFDWGLESPDELLSEDSFSVRWTAELEVPYTETYTFITNIFLSDGIRLWVNGQLLTDHWTGAEPWEKRATIDLPAGQASIRVEYFEAGHRAVARLSWESPSIPREIIPRERFSLPVRATALSPVNGFIGVKQIPTLRWLPGDGAIGHDVYFGDEYEAVLNADTTTPDIYRGEQALENTKYDLPEAPLEWGKTYYWRIDERNVDGTTSESSVWSFTVADFIIVDNFEDYNDDTNLIYRTWKDGYGEPLQGIPGNGTGSIVGWGKKPFAEQLIIHTGRQSMPLFYNNSASPYYSEAIRTWDTPQDWTEQGVATLMIWFNGLPDSVGGITYDPVARTYTMTGSGEDIYDVADQRQTGYHDEFHFAYKQLSGEGSIIAKVESLTETDEWTKAGVMIRETLDANSVCAMIAITPGNGVTFQYRIDKAGETTTMAQEDVNAPHWIKISRTQNTFTGDHSEDNQTWIGVQGDTPSVIEIPMNVNTYIGLALTSHDAEATAEAVFSNVSTTGTVSPSGPFTDSNDIGIMSNDADMLYVIVEDNASNFKLIEHQESNGTQSDNWQDWNIDLQVFRDANVDLTAITKVTLGVGNKTAPSAKGSGTMYFDDIRVNLPTGCFPSSHPDYNAWVAVGEPECWCYPRQCHGDTDNASQGKKKYWVSTNDLDILIAAWNKPLGDLVGNQICADFDHGSQGKKKYRVSTNDLDILVANWNQANAPDPDCFD